MPENIEIDSLKVRQGIDGYSEGVVVKFANGTIRYLTVEDSLTINGVSLWDWMESVNAKLELIGK